MKTAKPKPRPLAQPPRCFFVPPVRPGVRPTVDFRSVSEERYPLLDARTSSERLRSPLVAVLGGVIR